MKKTILRTVLFVLIFALLFLGISPIFIPKRNSNSAGVHDAHAKGFLAEPENSLDVLFVGDSEAYSSFIPLRLWENYGMTSYVCSAGDQMLYQSWSYLERVFEKHSPKVVVLETNALYREYTLSQLLAHEMEEKFPFLRYHDRWKSLTAEDWGTPVNHTTIIRDRGYAYHPETVPGEGGTYMIQTEEVQPVPVMNQLFVRRIRDFCREKDARLLLVSTPSSTNWSTYYHNGVTKLTDEHGIAYLDMNLMPEEIPIDWQTDSYDGGDHLNYSGACKVTDHMGALLWDTGLFADKRQQAGYEPWQDAVKEFAAQREAK